MTTGTVVRPMAEASRARLAFFARHALGTALLFAAVYGGADLIARLHAHRVSSYTALDDFVPFVPGATFVYSSLWPMFALAPFALRDERDIVRLSRVLRFEILVAGAFFLAAPMPDRAPAVDPAALGAAFRLADWVNLEFNQFPSLHAAFGFTLAWALGRSRGALVRITLYVWSLAIGAAAVLTWQHAILDVVGGAALTAAVVALVERRFAGDPLKDCATATARQP